MKKLATGGWGRQFRPHASPHKSFKNSVPSATKLKQAIAPLVFYRRELPTMSDPKCDIGWVSAGLCIFHKDRHVGSFRVNLDTGAFTCFSCETKGRDIIAFTQLLRGLTFPQALRHLAEAWRVGP